MNSRSVTTIGTATTLCSGLLGGELFSALGLPMPWLLGPIIGSAINAVAGLPAGMPGKLRSAVLVVVGLMIGSTVHHDTLASITRWPISMIAVVIYVMVVTATIYFFLRRFAGFDPITAYFASAPGGFLAMIMIGGSFGGRERNITITHVVRVVLVIFTLVLSYRLMFGTTPAHPLVRDIGGHLSFWQGMELAVLGGGGWYMGNRLKLPVGAMLGPLLLIAIVQLLGMPAVHIPESPLYFAEFVVGSAIGADFAGVTLRELRQGLTLSVIATGYMLVLSLIFSLILVPFTRVHLETLFLALSPGGLSGVSLIALALGCNPAFVTAHNLLRMLLIVLAAPLVFRMINDKTRRILKDKELDSLS